MSGLFNKWQSPTRRLSSPPSQRLKRRKLRRKLSKPRRPQSLSQSPSEDGGGQRAQRTGPPEPNPRSEWSLFRQLLRLRQPKQQIYLVEHPLSSRLAPLVLSLLPLALSIARLLLTYSTSGT